MTETIINFAKMFIAILPFLVLCISNYKVNLPKAERSKQFIMPVLTLVYVVVAMLFINPINEWLMKIINKLPDWISSLTGYNWMPDIIESVLLQAESLIRKLIKELNLSFWIFFISNTVIISVYLFLKKIVLGFISKFVKTESELHSKVAERFYEYFTETNTWCIKEGYVQARSLFSLFYYSAIVISAILMLLTRNFYYEGLLKTIFYPVFGILVVGEFYFYLDGKTKREYAGYITGEDEEAYKVVNYSLLRKFLRNIFGDKLLSENTSINNALADPVTTDEIIRDLEKSDDPKITCFASFVDSLNRTGFSIDHNYLRSSLEMLNGKSILFNNPFYNDLIPYAFYPMNRALLQHQKVLVVLGRHSIENDIVEWLEKGIESITNIPFIWNIGVLNSEKQDVDIGIVTRSDVLNIELHNANADFLENVGFVVIIEPSKLLSTAQIGLNLIVKKCRSNEDKNIVYCMCDKNCDGLVDAMSHVLMTSITEVSATKKHLGTSSYMCWETDNEYLHHRLVPNISRYLGLGTELAFAALKNQVSKTVWFGGEAFPVADIRWIAKQYYYDLTKYASLPTNQDAMDEGFNTSYNLWSAEVEKNNYLTVEDESFNMFEILREFSTRTKEQGFVNIISSDYLLKDYMADNASIFQTDAKAIPMIVADYTRSHRNTILRLVLMMSTYPVPAEVLIKELSLLGISVFDLKKQLWYELYNCYSSVAQTLKFSGDYKLAVEQVFNETLKYSDGEWTSDIFTVRDTFNLKLGKIETVYSINDKNFLNVCVSSLRSAGYVAEDEKGQYNYLGAELGGHIYQRYLPGQYFTFGGKYYEMQHLTADGQILVRRAADHINGRPTYRQIRNYVIKGIKPSARVASQQNVGGMKVIKEFADIIVETPGYYRMNRFNDFSTAKRISFEGDNGIETREYRNKEILRIELPSADGKLTDNIRYTITLLFNEIFKTLFAENHAFICALTDDSSIEDKDGDSPLTYSLRGDGCEIQQNSIYIIEDSQLDLGLTVAVERNLERIFNIIYDYIDWHMAKLEDSLCPKPDPKPTIIFSDTGEDGEPKPKKKKGLGALGEKIKKGVKKIIDKMKGWFKKKPKNGEDIPEGSDVPENTDIPEGPDVPEGTDVPDDINIPEGTDTPEDSDISDGTDIPENSDTPEETDIPDEPLKDGVSVETTEATEMPFENDVINSAENGTKKGLFNERPPYHERYYMLYGRDSEFSFVDLAGTLDYLSAMEMSRNPLKQAREGKKIAEYIEATYLPGKPDARYCDFCGTEIFGVEYETLADGRDRCLSCSRTAIKTGEEFRKIFEDVKRNMESFFGIRINAGIKVEMVNSKTLHKKLGKAFIPTPNADGRILGVAIKNKEGYSLFVENGSPRMASMLTMAHELTHIWQYLNWDDKAIKKKYGKDLYLQIYEGMAKWVEIQYAYLINEPATAKREEIITSYREDEYGYGFLRYRANYPFSLGTIITKPTPFLNLETPLDPAYCGSFTVIRPTDGINPGDIYGGDDDTPSYTGGDTPISGEPIKGPIERNPSTFNRYAYSLLNADEQIAYTEILNAINSFLPECNSLSVHITDTQISKVLDYIQRDHPEIFWFQHGATYYFDTVSHIVNKVELKYCMTNAEAAKRQTKIDTALKSFLSTINDTMSDYEVTLHIYENIIDLVDYDSLGLEKQRRSTLSPEVPDDLRSIYGVFVNKKAVCSGYAKAMQYLLNMFGIECVYVTSDTHAWNLIKLEGDYYHLDVTWGDGSNTKKEMSKSNAVNYDCFCITTEEVLRLDSHIPESVLPVPECTATKCNYYRRHGLYFASYDLNRVKSILCDCFTYNKFDVSFKFASFDVYNEAKTDLIDNGKFREAIQFAVFKSNRKVSSSYSYSVADDRFTISFYMSKS